MADKKTIEIISKAETSTGSADPSQSAGEALDSLRYKAGQATRLQQNYLAKRIAKMESTRLPQNYLARQAERVAKAKEKEESRQRAVAARQEREKEVLERRTRQKAEREKLRETRARKQEETRQKREEQREKSKQQKQEARERKKTLQERKDALKNIINLSTSSHLGATSLASLGSSAAKLTGVFGGGSSGGGGGGGIMPGFPGGMGGGQGGGLLAAVGKAAKAMAGFAVVSFGFVAAGKALQAAVRRMVDSMNGFSAAVNIAVAQNEIRFARDMFRRSRRIGGEVAALEQTVGGDIASELRNIYDFMVKTLAGPLNAIAEVVAAGLKIIGLIAEGVAKIAYSVEWITEKILSWAAQIPGIGIVFQKILAWMQQDEANNNTQLIDGLLDGLFVMKDPPFPVGLDIPKVFD